MDLSGLTVSQVFLSVMLAACLKAIFDLETVSKRIILTYESIHTNKITMKHCRIGKY